ncbi:MAG: hypothetical protein SNJ52_04260 [Verrucomicrobiia bacterium]
MIPFKPLLQIVLSPVLPTTFFQFITFQIPKDSLPLVTGVATAILLFSLAVLFSIARPLAAKVKAFERELVERAQPKSE